MAYESITDECVVYRVAKQLLGISTEEPRRWDKNALRHVSAYEVLRALEAAYRAGAASEYRRTEVRSRGFEPVIGKVTEYVGPVPIDLPEGKLRIIGILPKAMLVEEEGRSLDQVLVVTDDRLLSIIIRRLVVPSVRCLTMQANLLKMGWPPTCSASSSAESKDESHPRWM